MGFRLFRQILPKSPDHRFGGTRRTNRMGLSVRYTCVTAEGHISIDTLLLDDCSRFVSNGQWPRCSFILSPLFRLSILFFLLFTLDTMCIGHGARDTLSSSRVGRYQKDRVNGVMRLGVGQPRGFTMIYCWEGVLTLLSTAAICSNTLASFVLMSFVSLRDTILDTRYNLITISLLPSLSQRGLGWERGTVGGQGVKVEVGCICKKG